MARRKQNNTTRDTVTTLNLDYETGAAYYGDCEEIIQAWKEQGVQGIIDLIYLDPPFNSNRNYGAPTSKAKKNDNGSIAAFSDMWTYDQQARDRVDRICNQQKLHPARLLIKSLKPYLEANDPGMLAYLSYMADRLRLLKGLLRETGSIYLHCDPHANYYLRMLMDSIFGAENFRNEIVWLRKQGERHNLARLRMPSSHDVILWYNKSKKAKYNIQFTPYSDEYIKKNYKYKDKKGVYATFPCTNDKGGNREYEFKGITRAWRFSQARMQKMHDENLLVQATEKSPFRYKKYLDKTAGIKIEDVWVDIPQVRGEEWLGYPTQKPLALLDRIIKASTNEGDLILDPFCGCGTAMHSAVNNKRRFIGIDISVFTIYEVARKRLKRECGLDVPIYGIPTNFAGAKLLAERDKFKFESWAAESLNFGNIGIRSKTIQRCDGGIDGKGWLYGQTEYGEDEIIVQVKGGGFTIDQVRAFKDRINSIPGVAAGIFITLDGDNHKGKQNTRWTKGMEREALECGTFKMPGGDKTYRRMQHWSVRDRFQGEDGVYPKMPITINPDNDKPMVEIGDTIPNKPLPLARKPARRGRRRNGKEAPLF